MSQDVRHLEARASPLVPPMSASVMLLVAAVLLSHAVRILYRPDTFAAAEAMLLVNIQEVGWDELFQPLPFYDRAAPALHLALLKVMDWLGGPNLVLMRVPSLLAVLLAAGAVLALPRLSWLERCLAATALAGSAVLAKAATGIEPFAFDLVACLGLILVFHPDAAPFCRSHLVRAVMLVLAFLSAPSFPIMVATVGLTLSWVTYRRSDGDHGKRLLRTLGQVPLLVIGLAAYIVYYRLILRPAGADGLLADSLFGHLSEGYDSGDSFYLGWLASRLLAFLHGHYGIVAIPALLLMLLGFYWLGRRRDAYGLQIVVLLVTVMALNLSGLYPVLDGRFTLFALPWIAVAFGIGCARLIALVPSVLLRTLAGLAMAGMALWPAIGFLIDPAREQAREALAFLATERTTPVVVTTGAQPVYDLYFMAARDSGDGARGRECRRGLAAGMTDRCSRPAAAFDGAFAGRETKWHLMEKLVERHSAPTPAVAQSAAADLRNAYIAWLSGELARSGRAFLLVMRHDQRDIDKLVERSASLGRLSLVLDERPAGGNGASGSARLYLFQPAEARQ